MQSAMQWLTAQLSEHLVLVSGVAGWILAALLFWRLSVASRRSAGMKRRAQSAEVRSGQLLEQLAPMLQGFPVDVHKPGTSTLFLGRPVDFVHFDPEEGVVFVEVKTGTSQLDSKQRRLRDLVTSGQVRWSTFSVRSS